VVDLPVLQVPAARQFVADLTLGSGRVVFDDLGYTQKRTARKSNEDWRS
jgi:acetoacetate decarboxylase